MRAAGLITNERDTSADASARSRRVLRSVGRGKTTDRRRRKTTAVHRSIIDEKVHDPFLAVIDKQRLVTFKAASASSSSSAAAARSVAPASLNAHVMFQ